MDKNKGKVKLNDELLDQVSGGQDTNSSNGGQKLCCSDCGCFFDVPQFFPGNGCPSCHVGTLHIYHELVVVDEYEAYL